MASWLVGAVAHHRAVSITTANAEYDEIAKQLGLVGSSAASSRSSSSSLQWYELSRILRAEQLGAPEEAFKDADADGDGRLTREEFVAFRHLEWSLPVRRRFATTFVLAHDLDKDGVVNATEFITEELKVCRSLFSLSSFRRLLLLLPFVGFVVWT